MLILEHIHVVGVTDGVFVDVTVGVGVGVNSIYPMNKGISFI